MTKKKSTKRALISSLLILAMCFTMLVGTTFAWFTDSVTAAGNIIKSGKLDVELQWANGAEAVPAAGSTDWKDASSEAIFNYDLWEPGYVQARHVRIANIGTLALKYQFAIQVNGELATNSEGHTLADAIDVYYVDPAAQVTARDALPARLGTLTEVLANMGTTASGKLIAGAADQVTIVLKMREDAGNEYQNMSVGTSFSVQVLATQAMEEVDSFDKTYDELADGTPDNAVFPVLAPANANEFDAVVLAANDGDVVDFGGNNAVLFANKTVESEITIQNTKFDTSASSANVAIYNVDFKKPVTFKDCDFESTLGIYKNKFEGGVTFENCDMHNTDYGIYNNALGGNATFKNCTLKSDWCYTVNFQGGSGHNTVTFENCTLIGWLSFDSADCGNVIFKNCTFKTEDVDYSSIRLYQDAQFINCDFSAFEGKTNPPYAAIEAGVDNSTITFTGCTGLDVAAKCGYNGTRTGVTWIVDGNDVTAQVA